MASLICTLRGALRVRDPNDASLVEALRSFVNHPDQMVGRWSWPHPEIELHDGAIELNLYVRGRPGYRSDPIEALVQALCPHATQGGHLKLEVVEFPGHEPQLYFLGATDAERKAAAVGYGLELAREFVEPAIGYQAFNALGVRLIADVKAGRLPAIQEAA